MKAKINDIFLFTDKLEATRSFYSRILELEEIWSNMNGEDMSYVVYNMEFEQKLHFYQRKQRDRYKNLEWALQPGSNIPSGVEVYSFTFEYKKNDFNRITERCFANNIRSYQEKIENRGGYLALTIMDPNNITIDLYTIINPESTE